MLLICLLLLGNVAKGIVATDPTATANDDISAGSSTTSASVDSTSTPTQYADNAFTSSTAFTTDPTGPALFTTTESVTTETTSLTPTATPPTRPTDPEPVTGAETDNSTLTTTSPPDSTSTPTNGASTTNTNAENGQSTITSEAANPTVIPTQDNERNGNGTGPTPDPGTTTTQTPHNVSDTTLTTPPSNSTAITLLTTMPTKKTTEPVTTPSSTVTTVSPVLTTIPTTSNTTTAAPLIPTPGPPIVCHATSCPSESVCLNGTCQCVSGTFMVNGQCQQAQVFPGQLHLINLTFSEGMTDRSSEIFQSTAAQITSALGAIFQNDPEYLGSDVVQLQPGSVIASVNNNFNNTSLTQAEIDAKIQSAAATSNGILANATFTATNVCENTPLTCDLSSTTCSVRNGMAACSCKEGFIPLVSVYSNNRSCRACPSGQRAVRDTCEPCAFGYSGFNCNDSALLAVVVISCVLGGVLLLLVLALLIYCCWRCCSKDKPDYENSPYSSGDSNQPWPTGITPIPRATTKWESGAIEMTEGGSTNNLVDKKHQTNGLTGSYDLNPEDMKTFKGKNTSRYSYLVQGHENPYFLPGDERKS